MEWYCLPQAQDFSPRRRGCSPMTKMIDKHEFLLPAQAGVFPVLMQLG